MEHRISSSTEDLDFGRRTLPDPHDRSKVTELKERASKLSTPEECERFATNVEERGFSEAAVAARIRSAELRAAKQHPTSAVERELLESLYTYERFLFGSGRKTRRPWRVWMDIKRRGLLPAVEQLLLRRPDGVLNDFLKLAQSKVRHMALEAVVLRHPQAFSVDVVKASKRRLRASAARTSA